MLYLLCYQIQSFHNRQNHNNKIIIINNFNNNHQCYLLCYQVQSFHNWHIQKKGDKIKYYHCISSIYVLEFIAYAPSTRYAFKSNNFVYCWIRITFTSKNVLLSTEFTKVHKMISSSCWKWIMMWNRILCNYADSWMVCLQVQLCKTE